LFILLPGLFQVHFAKLEDRKQEISTAARDKCFNFRHKVCNITVNIRWHPKMY